MRLDKFIEILKQYPEDSEVYMGNHGTDDNCKIFSVTATDDGGSVIISNQPHALEHALDLENDENTQINKDDTFSLYSIETGDVVEYKYGEYNVKYKNKYRDGDSFDEYQWFSEPNLEYVGGLRRFLSAFDDGMRINIKSGESHAGVIHEIHKSEVCYLVGTYDDVGEECEDELFLIYGVPISCFEGGGSFPLTDNKPWGFSDEINSVIAQPIIKYFTKDGEYELKKIITPQEAKEWGSVIEDIKTELLHYYSFSYRLNGS